MRSSLLLVLCSVACAPRPCADPEAAHERRVAAAPRDGSPQSPNEAPETSAPTDTDSSNSPASPFIEDDFDGALAKGRSEGKAVFVDAWAPWCHTCLSMRHFVLEDPRVVALGERVVFASIDTDRDENVAFMERIEVRTWPTFYVFDAASGTAVDAWPGAASATELVRFVTAALDTIEAERAGSLDDSTPGYFLGRGKLAELHGDPRGAAEAYRSALSKDAGDFERRSEAALGAVRSLGRSGQYDACVEVGKAELPHVAGSALPADFAQYYLSCVARVSGKRAHLRGIVERLTNLSVHPPPGSSTDDSADLLRILADAQDLLGRKGEGKRTREKRLALLEAAASAADTPAVAQTYDAARTSTYVALGRPEDALALLETREAELPSSYQPPSRRAGVLHALGRREEALAALEVAIARSYGMVKPRLLERKARLLSELGRTEEHRATLAAIVDTYEAAPPTAMNARRLAEARRALKEAQGATP